MKKPILVIVCLISVIILLSIVKTGLSAKMATSGIELSQTQDEISLLDTQNLVLQQKLLSLTSLTTIDEKAKKMGFAHDNKEFFVAAPLHLSMKE